MEHVTPEHRTRAAFGRRWAIGLVPLVVAALLGSTSGPALAQERDLIRVRYQGATEGFSALPALVAVSKGYFEREGIKLDYQPIVSNTGIIGASLLSGGTDIAFSNFSSTLAGQRVGQPFVGIGHMSAPLLSVVLRKDAVSALKRKGVTVKSPVEAKLKALKGLSLAIFNPGSGSQNLFRGALHGTGLNPDKDMTLRVLNDATSLVAAARQGQVNGFVNSEPSVAQALAEGWATLWINFSGELPATKGLPFGDFVSTKGYVNRNQEAVRRFMRAILRADRDLQLYGDDPALRETVKNRFFRATADGVFNKAWDNSLPGYRDAPVPTEKNFKRGLEFFNRVFPKPFKTRFVDAYDVTGVLAAKKDLGY